jgi:DHA3 family macrolide efflux protein-like MFS transporter
MNNHKTDMLTVLKNRDFLLLWLSQLVSKIGDNFAVIAALTLINAVAQASGIAVVMIGVATTIPQLFALASGVFVDRFSRKAVMIATDLLRAGFILMALLVQDAGQLWLLYLTAFIVMGLGAVFIPARNASIPNMVPEEHLLTANALIQATELVSLIVGASLATVIIGLTSIQTAFVIDSATFFVSALFLVGARIPAGKAASMTSGARGELRTFWAGFTEGVRYIRSNKGLLQLMAITTMATLGLSATTLLAGAYFEELLDISAEYMGFLLAMEGVGMALGALLISTYATWARSRQTVSVTMIILGLGILAFALVQVYWVVLIGALVIGICIVSARSTLAAMTQALVPDAQRGRVESAMVTVIGIGTMGALIMAGILGDFVGPRSIFAVTGIVVLAAGIASVFTLRSVEEQLLLNGFGDRPSPPLE